jgi:hypothetical protein
MEYPILLTSPVALPEEKGHLGFDETLVAGYF